jgi:hypothetical protein
MIGPEGGEREGEGATFGISQREQKEILERISDAVADTAPVRDVRPSVTYTATPDSSNGSQRGLRSRRGTREPLDSLGLSPAFLDRIQIRSERLVDITASYASGWLRISGIR